MEEWKEYRLGDFMEFNPRISLKKDTVARKITMDQLVPHSRDIYSWSYEPYSGGAKFQNGDTIMARITPCLENGKHAFISLLDENEIAYGSTEYIVIRGRKGISDNLFVYYLTHFPSFKDAAIKSMVGTSGRQRAQVDVLENMTMKLPSIAEQKSIADILTKLDDKIAVNKQINDNFYYAIFEVLLIWLVTSLRNDNLEQQAQALFKSWLVDFEPFRDQPFVESELGMIPEGWRVIELEETCTIRYGKGLGKKDLTQDGFPVFGGNGIIGFYTHFLYELPQILVSCRGAASGKIIESLPKSYVTSNSLVLELKDRSYYNYIKLLLLNNPLYDYATGSAQPQITIDNIKGIKILLPLKEVINKVNHTLENIGSIQRNNNEESRRLASLRDTLLPRLMSGELKVEDVAL